MLTKHIRLSGFAPFMVLLLLSACASEPIVTHKPAPSQTTTPMTTTCVCDEKKADGKNNDDKKFIPIPEEKKPAEASKPADAKIADYSLLKPSGWEGVEGFYAENANANLGAAWQAWKLSCSTLKNKAAWKKVCEAADSLDMSTNGHPTNSAILSYFKTYFSVYQASNLDGSDSGLITGYYEPVLKGSRTQSSAYPYPLYTSPSDLITVTLDEIYPELKFKRIRGRLNGNKLVPYYNRAEIEVQNSPINQHAFVYINDKIDVFFLQVQGSGLVKLDNGEELHVGYADQNGHAYQSIGKFLIANGELSPSEASMQGIKNWAAKNPEKLQFLLNQNPSYVFFRELPPNLPGPLGALGVPLLAEQVVAVDPKFIPLGAPIFLSTTLPNSVQPLQKLMMAQDTGGAIKGGVRADFYWGSGSEAGEKAGSMKQSGKIWVLLPSDFKLPPLLSNEMTK